MTVLEQAFRFESSAASHLGLVRTLNEDAYLDRPDLGLWAVADGMGGHDSGDFAARLIVRTLDGIAPPASPAAFLAEVKARLNQAHDELHGEAARRGPEHLIGSTVVAVLVSGQHFACIWAGDSRLYRFRRGTLVQITRDHSHVQDLIELGELSAEEADNHPHANIITRAVGAAEHLVLDLRRDRLEPDDILLLCSDGLSRTVPEAEIATELGRGDIADAAPRLIELALRHHGRDNITAVAVACRAQPSPAAGPDPEPRARPAGDPEAQDAGEAIAGAAPGRIEAGDEGSEPTLPPLGSDWAGQGGAPDRPERLGRYRVQDKLGEGAMAEVFRAFDPDIGRSLAIKMLRHEVADDAEYNARFLREAKAVGALNHPNIVAIYDVGQAEGRPYIVMELIEGRPLDRVIETDLMMPVEDVIRIGIQFARGLAYAHARGIVHRDVKPSNALLLPDSTTVKITDFGIARFEDADRMHQTQAGMVIGTPQYMSPEQARGEHVDGRSDLFSLGAILYELLTGRKAFTGNSMTAVLLKITQEDPPPMREFVPDLPVGLVRIVEKLLRKQPERRFASGDELAQALGHELDILVEEQRSGQKRRRISAWMVWTAATALILTGLVAGIGWFLHRAQTQSIEAQLMDFGDSLAMDLAGDLGVILGPELDWGRAQVLIHETARLWTVSDLAVTDDRGIVRGAIDPARIGRPFVPPEGLVPQPAMDGVEVARLETVAGLAGYQFTAPIGGPEAGIGRLHLGVSGRMGQEMSDLTLGVIACLAVLALATVVCASMVVRHAMLQPLRTLRRSFEALAAGNDACHITHSRTDEIGAVYDSFNTLAETLRRRSETGR